MGSLSPLHWLLFLAVALLLFGGRGKISGLMGDFGKGVKAFKQGLKESGGDGDEPRPDTPPKALATETAKPTAPAESKDEAATH